MRHGSPATQLIQDLCLISVFVFVLASASSPSVAQANPTARMVKFLESREKAGFSVSATGVERLKNDVPGTPRPATETQYPERGVKVVTTRGGEGRFLSAFDKDNELVAGGVLWTTDGVVNKTLDQMLRGDRVIYGKDATYQVHAQSGLSVANVDTDRHRPARSLRDFGWNIPYTADLLLDGLRSGRYRFAGSEKSPKWGMIDHYTGSYQGAALLYQVSFWVAEEHNYLVVLGDVVSGDFHDRFTMDQIQTVAGLWLPQGCTFETLNTVDGHDKPSLTDTYWLDTVSVSGMAPDKWKIATTYDRIVDGKTGDYFRVTPSGERIFMDMKRKSPASFAAFGWLYIASVTSLLVLTVGAYIRWKHGQLASR